MNEKALRNGHEAGCTSHSATAEQYGLGQSQSAQAAHLLCVEDGERGADGAPQPRPAVFGVLGALERQLQVQDVVDDVLQDLHAAHAPVLRDGGHQAL